MKKPSKNLSLTQDRNFKAFFTRKKKLLISIMENFLPLPEGSVIEDIHILNTELPSDKFPEEYKFFVLDLRVQLRRRINGVLQNTETANVEVQTTAQKHFTDRLLMYLSRLYSGQIRKGENVDKLLPVYSLVFTTVNLKEFEGIKDYYHVCNIRRIGHPEVVMSRGMSFVIVELDKFQSQLGELIDIKENWCYFLKRSGQMDQKEYLYFKDKGGIMAEAAEHLWVLSKDETLQELDMVKERARRDQVDREEFVRDEGREEGLEKGREEGMEKGFKKGIEKGREEGMEKGMEKIALNMLKENLNISLISTMTGLSKNDILKLKK